MPRIHPTIKAIADPRKPAGGWFAPHILLIVALAALIAFLAGAFAVTAYNAHFYRTTYKAPLKVPHVYQRVHVSPKVAPRATDAGSIHFAYLAEQTADQGTIGSCQAWSFARELSYAANWNRQPNGTHWHRFYSPRFLYDAISNCQDQGSYLEQFPPVVANAGVPLWKQMPYGAAAETLSNPLADFVVDCPTPQWAQTLARLHSLGVTETPLFQNQGAGPGGLALIHQALATHHMVNVDFPVFAQYDQAAADGSTVTLPLPGQVDRGGHANSDVKSDPSHNNGDGTFGADLFANQWSKYAGVGADGIRHTGPHNGFVWVSWAFIEKYVWGAAVIHVAGSSPGKPARPQPSKTLFPYVPSHAPLHKAPLTAGAPRRLPVGASARVTGVYTADTHVNISNAINQSAAAYGFSAPGFAALLGVESGINQYAPHYPIAGAGYCDYSAGLSQITVCTAAGLGIGNGTTSQANINYVFWYEQADPVRDIWLSAKLIAEFKRAVCFDFKILYAAWNEGPGYGCYSSAYSSPSNWITQNAVASYNTWWNLIWSRNVTYYRPPPPPPKPHYSFPGGHWQQYRLHHHLKRISHTYHHKLSWAASLWWAFDGQVRCGGILRREHWNARANVMHTAFQACDLYTWPTRPGYVPKWHHHHRKR